MGAWGTKPWENDGAADWFGDVLEGNPLIDRVDETLRGGSGDQQYAALWVVARLARVYVWPIERLDGTLRLARTVADAMLAGEDGDGFLEDWEDDPDIVTELTKLRQTITKRIRD